MADDGGRARHEAVIDRWRRKHEQAQDAAEHMEKEIKKVLSKKLSEKRRNVALDLKEVTNNRSNYNRGEGGFGVYDDGEIVTGHEKYVLDD